MRTCFCRSSYSFKVWCVSTRAEICSFVVGKRVRHKRETRMRCARARHQNASPSSRPPEQLKRQKGKRGVFCASRRLRVWKRSARTRTRTRSKPVGPTIRRKTGKTSSSKSSSKTNSTRANDNFYGTPSTSADEWQW